MVTETYKSGCVSSSLPLSERELRKIRSEFIFQILFLLWVQVSLTECCFDCHSFSRLFSRAFIGAGHIHIKPNPIIMCKIGCISDKWCCEAMVCQFLIYLYNWYTSIEGRSEKTSELMDFLPSLLCNSEILDFLKKSKTEKTDKSPASFSFSPRENS